MTKPEGLTPEPEKINPVASLTQTLNEVSSLWGDTRSFSTTTRALRDTNLRDLFPDIPEDADYVQMPRYERSDYSTYIAHLESAGITISLAEKTRYFHGDKKEPIRFGFSIANEQGSLFADFRVAPDYTDYETSLVEPRDPSIPMPTAEITVSEGASIEKILKNAKSRLSLATLDPETPMDDEYAKNLADCLSYLAGMIRENGHNQGAVSMSDLATQHLEELAGLLFYREQPASDPNTFSASTRPESEVQLRRPPRPIDKYRGVHYAADRLPQPHDLGVLGKFSDKTRYLRGCTVDKEIAQGAQAVTADITDGDIQYEVALGIAPQGKAPIARAGKPGRYLLRIHQKGKEGQPGRNYHRYLDECEVKVAMAPGEPFVLPMNPARNRNSKGAGLRVSGVIQEMNSYR